MKLHMQDPKIIEKHLDEYFSHVELTCDLISISIEKYYRQFDRAEYIVKVESFDQAKLSINHADRFPRFYFYFSSMILEVAEWLERRDLFDKVEVKMIKFDIKSKVFVEVEELTNKKLSEDQTIATYSYESNYLRILIPHTNSIIAGEASDNIGRGDRRKLYKSFDPD